MGSWRARRHAGHEQREGLRAWSQEHRVSRGVAMQSQGSWKRDPAFAQEDQRAAAYNSHLRRKKVDDVEAKYAPTLVSASESILVLCVRALGGTRQRGRRAYSHRWHKLEH